MTTTAVAVEADPTRPGWRQLILSGRVTVADAVDLHRAAVELASGCSPVRVDCTAATLIDASAVQVILALGQAVELAGRRFEVTAGGVVHLFRLAGLAQIVSG